MGKNLAGALNRFARNAAILLLGPQACTLCLALRFSLLGLEEHVEGLTAGELGLGDLGGEGQGLRLEENSLLRPRLGLEPVGVHGSRDVGQIRDHQGDFVGRCVHDQLDDQRLQRVSGVEVLGALGRDGSRHLSGGSR